MHAGPDAGTPGQPKAETPTTSVPKLEALKLEAPKLEAPKLEAPKIEAPKLELPKPPKVEAPKLEAPAPPSIPTPKLEAPQPPALPQQPGKVLFSTRRVTGLMLGLGDFAASVAAGFCSQSALTGEQRDSQAAACAATLKAEL